MAVELEQAWETHITTDFFALAKAELEKNNPDAIGLFEVMIKNRCLRAEKPLDYIVMSKRVFDNKFFENFQGTLVMGNPLVPQVQEELEASEYLADRGYVPAMYACGRHYKRLAEAANDLSQMDNAVKWFSRAAECGNRQAIWQIRSIKRQYKRLPCVKHLPSEAKLRDREKETLDFEEKAAELMARIPAIAAIMKNV